MSEWKPLEKVEKPICPLISAHTVKQANKYIECVKEKCMWWNKCKPEEPMVFPRETVQSISIIDDSGNLKFIPLDRVIIERKEGYEK